MLNKVILYSVSLFLLLQLATALAQPPLNPQTQGSTTLKPHSAKPQRDKTIIGGFKQVSGMDSETEVVEFRQGNDRIVRKRPGRTTRARIRNGSLYLRMKHNRYVRVRNGQAKLKNGKTLIIKNYKIVRVR